MSVSEHANYLLNEYGRLQFDYAAYCKPDGESLRNEARNNLEEYIAELEAERRWIPVSEGTKGLEILEDYLTTDESGEISKMKYCGVLRGVQKWLRSDNAFYHPTHWMPLPELPEVK